MSKKSIVKALFYFFPFFLVFHLAYGLVVREPYPSFMMPGFSRIDNDGKTYELLDREFIVVSENSDTARIRLNDINTTISKIALSRLIDVVYFGNQSAKTENSAQRKYYGIIRSLIGEEFYEKHITSVRYPKMESADIEQFNSWLIDRVKEQAPWEISKLQVQRIKSIRDFKSGAILDSSVVDQSSIIGD